MHDLSPTPCDVLLVDDDDATRRLFEHVLTRTGLTVITARDGMEALEKLSTHAVDTMILDLMMPRMSGFEVLEKLAAEDPDRLPHTIVLSAASAQWVSKAGNYPVAAVLRKPVDLDTLVETVLNCLVRDSAMAAR